tara:strand:- start:792 stop:1247 length:456 start_codon:yes stop_codon:yes gene_type:complete
LRNGLSQYETHKAYNPNQLKNKDKKVGTFSALVNASKQGDKTMELRKIDLNTTTLTLSIYGDLDAAGSRDAQTDIDDVISNDGHPEIEVDFSQVEFLDSSGVGAIVYMFKRLTERERNMRLENVSGQPLEIMNLLRIGHAIPVNSKNPTNS